MFETKVVGGTPPPQSIAVAGQDLAVYPTFAAGAVAAKPDEYSNNGRIMGHYSVSAFTSAALQAANGVMCAFRWSDPASLAIIKRVRVAGAVVGAITAQQVDCDMVVARNYSVRDLTNATVVPVTADTSKMRQAMGTSVLGALSGGNIDVSSAAAGLTGGTKTLDASSVCAAPLPLIAFTAGAAGPFVTLFDSNQIGQHPLVLRQYEGFLVRNITVIGTGTLRYYVAIDWLEAVGY